MNEPLTNSELRRLLAAWCDGSLEPVDADRLNGALESSVEARRVYLQYATVEAELRSVHAGGGWVSAALDEAIVKASADRSAASRRLVESNTVTDWRAVLGRVAIAASLVGIAAVLTWVGARTNVLGMHADSGVSNGADRDRAVSSPAGAAVARVSATRNCRWAGESAKLGFGAELFSGQTVELDAGLAEISFESGARVLLEGPATLELGAESGALLRDGRLAATVPLDARGTLVRTPRMGVDVAGETGRAVFDTGWHFGLSADSAGDEVHVFRGVVDAYLVTASLDSAAEVRGRAVTLRPREAARIRPASTTVAKFFAERDKFVRSMSSTGGPHDGLYAYDGFDYPPGPLANQNGGFGWAGAWADIEAACPPGQLATNVVEAGGLTDAAIRGVGGHAAQIAQQNRIRRALSTSLGGVFDAAELVENQDGHRLVGANGKTVYLSFLQHVDRVGDGFYGVELHRGDGNPNRVLCVGNGADGAGYGVTSNYNAYGKTNYGRLGLENDATNLIVVKIEYGAEHRDTVTVYRNPESLFAEGAAEAVARLRGNFAFDRISFGCFDGVKRHRVDELRVGTAYRAVTGSRGRAPSTLVAPLVLHEAGDRNAASLLATADVRRRGARRGVGGADIQQVTFPTIY